MSLRIRLVLTVVGLLVLGLAVSVGAIFGALQDWTGDQNDDVLTAVGRDFRTELSSSSSSSSSDVADRVWQRAASRGDIPSFFQVRTPDGQVRWTRSYGAVPSLPDDLWPVSLSPSNPDGGALRDVDTWLVRTSRVSEQGDILVVAMQTTKSAELVSRVRNVALISSFVALALLALLSLRLIRRGLRPLEDIASTAAAIGSGDLTRRVVGAGSRTEVGRLGTALNAMLAQLESAFHHRELSEDRLRRFVADASHELRTPIATIRGYAELFRRGAASRPDDLEKAMSRIESEASRMGSLVDELLLLARLDQGRPLDRAPVDLTELAADAVADALSVQSGHSCTLDYSAPVVVSGDAQRLRQVLGNLLSNVLQHTPEGTSAFVRVASVDSSAVVSVADDGPGMTPEQQAHVFERFYRGAHTDHSGAGLGMSIVAAVIAAHDGTVSVSSSEDGTTFTFTIPLA